MSDPELSQLAAFSEWDELAAAVQEELAASPSCGNLQGPTWRRLLAIHTSNACRAGHVGGVVVTLEGCITQMPTASVTGGAACELVLPNLFLQCTPPHAWVVHAEAETVEKAEEECCMQTFLFCLGAGPDLVRLHPSTLRDMGRIHNLGRRLQAAAFMVAPSVQGGRAMAAGCPVGSSCTTTRGPGLEHRSRSCSIGPWEQ